MTTYTDRLIRHERLLMVMADRLQRGDSGAVNRASHEVVLHREHLVEGYEAVLALARFGTRALWIAAPLAAEEGLLESNPALMSAFRETPLMALARIQVEGTDA